MTDTSSSLIGSALEIEQIAQLPSTDCLVRRRSQVQVALGKDQIAVIPAGLPQRRNFPANHYADYRASSHFLYLVGQNIPYSILTLTSNHATLYVPTPSASDALWHGEAKSIEQLCSATGCSVKFTDQLSKQTTSHEVLTLPIFQENTRSYLSGLLNQAVSPQGDISLIEALVNTRLIHDEEGIRELRLAAHLTALAHQAGREATPHVQWSHELRAAMEAPHVARGARLAYAPIITPHGEVLHNHHYHDHLKEGDLILADVGAETPNGWAGDVTRTWPVSGVWSETQRAIYDVVLKALRTSTSQAAPNVEYASLHQTSRRVLTEGLVELGILRGSTDDILDANTIALFFPHGIGHLLGLDVHDMEDLGDHAGYAKGRTRRDIFGWNYLRLDRPLQPGMAITIEPGFYQVPALLNNPTWAGPHAGEFINQHVLSQFADVRGIRIEDDILVTDTGHDVLSADIPSDPDDLCPIR